MQQTKHARFFKPLQWIFAILLIVYCVYVAAVAVFLNTPVFAHVAGMLDDERTHVRFKGAYSLYPGHLTVPQARVYIGDPNVSIGIDVFHVQARFSLKPLLKKFLVIDHLRAETVEMNVGMKSQAEALAFHRKFTRPEDLDLKWKQEQAVENEKNRLTLDFKEIIIDRLRNVRGDFGRLDGEMSLRGGFLIQPKVQVEIYPSTLYFLSGITGRADVKFDRFKTVEAPGNAVWPYVTAHVDLNVKTDSLQQLDMALQRLPGYSLDGVGSNGRVDVKIVKGQLQKGSFAESTASRVTIRTPGLDATGLGQLHWSVDSPETSRLHAKITGVQLNEKSGAVNRGKIRSADLDLRLFGNGLLHAFHGLSALVKMEGLEWKIQSPPQQGKNFSYHGRLTGRGQLAAFTGQVPAWAKRERSRSTELNLQIPELELKTSFVSTVQGTGRLRMMAHPIDLGTQSAQFPDLQADLDLRLGEHGTVKTKAKFSRLEHQLAPEDSWKGRLHWTFDKTDAIVEALANQTKLNGMLQSAAKVRDLELDLDCELNQEFAWIRFSQIRSSGVWKGYGTLRNDNRGLSGLFEVSVLSMPLGIWVQPEQTEVKFMPDAEWYNRAIAPPVDPQQPQIPLGSHKKPRGKI